MNNKLYYFDIEVRAANNKCILLPDLLGAIVNCYTFESSIKKAKAKIIQALDEDNYEVVQVNEWFVVDIDEIKRVEKLNDDEIDEFSKSDDVLYGKFYGWESEK